MVLAHELNDFTMKEAMKFYPPLKKVFDVRFSFTFYVLVITQD